MSTTIPQTPAEFETTRIIERPDGFYWQYKEAAEEFGPFATLLEAVEDMKDNVDQAIEPGENLTEAEEEIGIATWIDPETGEPAEDSVPHIEDH